MAAAGIIVVGGKILTVGGSIAVDQACCCDDQTPPEPTPCDDCTFCCRIPTFTFAGREDINGATATFTSTAADGDPCAYTLTNSTGGITSAELTCSGNTPWILSVETAAHTYLFYAYPACPPLDWASWSTSNGARVRRVDCGCLTDCSLCGCVYSATLSGTGNVLYDTEYPSVNPRFFPIDCEWQGESTGDSVLVWHLYCTMVSGVRKWRLQFRPWNYAITGSTDYLEFEETAPDTGCPVSEFSNIIHNDFGGSPAAVIDLRPCVCPPDCSVCCGTFFFNFSTGDFVEFLQGAPEPGNPCDYRLEDTSQPGGTLTCTNSVWTLSLDFSLTGGDVRTWTANGDANNCPPSDPAAWTQTVGTTTAITSITTSGCP